MDDYDYSKTAATMDAYRSWRAIVDKAAMLERREMDKLLKEMVPYLRSQGLDLNIRESVLDKEYHGSDGVRLAGQLVVSERAENNIEADKRSIEKWVAEGTELHGSARKIGEGPALRQMDDKPVGVWLVDISQS